MKIKLILPLLHFAFALQHPLQTAHLTLLNVLEPAIDKHTKQTLLLQQPVNIQVKLDKPFKYSRKQTPKARNTMTQEMLVPDHTDKETVINFARLTYDSYFEPEDGKWVQVPGWNVSSRFGWEGTGIRGYLFSDPTENILLIVIKGTSLATPIGSGPTAIRDKLNDNLMFSCCCAKAGWEWRPICDCPKGNTCSKSCLLRESNFADSYYNLAQTIYLAVKEWFPKQTTVWMTGHSLGGALASLVALTNDLAAFSFEAPGDLLYASRLGLLPMDDPTEYMKSVPIYAFGNDNDPIFLGLCTGVTSSCYWLDYALESKCHIGHTCLYPHTKSLHTSSIQYHSIEFVINNILEKFPVPECTVKPQCLSSECTSWEWVE